MKTSNFNFLINVRALNAPFSGVQRYLSDLLPGITSGLLANGIISRTISTRHTGIKAHLWEQTTAAITENDKLLWSPASTGPILRKNQILTIHDLQQLDHPEWFNAKFQLGYKFIVPLVARQCRHVIAISNFTKKRIVDRCKIPEEKISVIHNGINSRFHPIEKDSIIPILNKLKLPSDKYILCVGGLKPNKNLKNTLICWKKLSKSLPDDLWLYIVGVKDLNSKDIDCGDLIGLPKIKFLGFINDTDLPYLISGSKLFIFLSYYEGFGFPILEAMACGVPVVSSNATSLTEIANESAMLCDPDDIISICNCIKLLYYSIDKRTEFIKKGLENVKSFTLETSVSKYISLFHKLYIKKLQ